MFLLIGWIDFCTKTNVLLGKSKIDVYILLSFCLFYLRLIISREIAYQCDCKIKYVYLLLCVEIIVAIFTVYVMKCHLYIRIHVSTITQSYNISHLRV